jgi:hypothetical protein
VLFVGNAFGRPEIDGVVGKFFRATQNPVEVVRAMVCPAALGDIWLRRSADGHFADVFGQVLLLDLGTEAVISVAMGSPSAQFAEWRGLFAEEEIAARP